MKVLILGGSGFIGRRIVAGLMERPGFTLRILSRQPQHGAAPIEWIRGDAMNSSQLSVALQHCDGVISCIAGNARTIAGCAKALVGALQGRSGLRVVHLSSMAAYGDIEGDIEDDHPLGAGGDWYARAKREAERLLQSLVHAGHTLVLLRPGCVHGPGSPLWVTRLAACLTAQRLGDLGDRGDGWSNLVHADDVAHAAVAALTWQARTTGTLIANLAAPDSPRWNRYLVDMAVALGAIPVRRIPSWNLMIEAQVLAAPLRVWERLAPRVGVRPTGAPPAITPALLALFQQQRRLRAKAAESELGLVWTPYARSLAQSVHWYLDQTNSRDNARPAERKEPA